MSYIYTFFYHCLIFILTTIANIIWLSYFIKNFWLMVSISLILAIITTIFLSNKYKQKKIKDEVSKKDKEQIENIKHYLMFSNKKEVSSFLKKAINTNLYQSKTYDYLIDKKENIIYVPMHHKEQINIDDIAQICHVYKDKYIKIIICCNNYCDNIHTILNKHNLTNCISVLTIDNMYLSFIKGNTYLIPNTYNFTKSKEKHTFKEFCKIITSQNLWKRYIFYAFLMLSFNILNKEKIYFNIFACVFFIMAIACLCKKLFTHPNRDNL